MKPLWPGIVRRVGTVATLSVLVWSALMPVARAHEPIFGLGPHTLFQGGFSTSVSADYTQAEPSAEATTSTFGLTYGVTANLNLSLALPYAISVPVADHRVSGIAGPLIQVKWRPWASFGEGQVDALSLIAAIRLPTGSEELSQGSTGYVLGATAAREHQRYYLFGTLRYITQTAGLQGQPGDAFLFDAAVGLRPFVLEYDEPDLVFLVELNGSLLRDARTAANDDLALEAEAEGSLQSSLQGGVLKHAGGATQFVAGSGEGGVALAVTPELLLSLRNVMLRAGVQFPVYREGDLPGDFDYRLRVDLIAQF